MNKFQIWYEYGWWLAATVVPGYIVRVCLCVCVYVCVFMCLETNGKTLTKN
jgi:hypothetical protein